MGRSKAFSGKQKKEQLQAKKQKKQGGHNQFQQIREVNKGSDDGEDTAKFVEGGAGKPAAQSTSKFFEAKLVNQGRRGQSEFGDTGRYALKFRGESKAEIDKLKEKATTTIYQVLDEYKECCIEDFYTPKLDFPVRPDWNYKLSTQELEANESKYFEKYLQNIDDHFEKSELSYFELNLETWRQFWRVLEMSDILLCIVDIRFPALLFPPKLYEYAGKVLEKNIILILNKIDLCPSGLVLAWREYFKAKYPDIDILCFTSFPDYNLHGNFSDKSLVGKKRRARLRMASEGALEVYKACDKIVAGQVDLTKWKDKIMEEMHMTETEDDDSNEIEIGNVDATKPDTSYFEFKKYQDGLLTIGTIGQPNVGKSSLINALMGKKVVSVSKTPGHTKHFQTIFLTPNVRLCDCPGLIFPSRVPKPLQVLCGSYPIAQLREPYSTIKYLAERTDLISILKLIHPEAGETEWSAFDIADSWAIKRGYYTAKAARPDSYRAANQLLRLALEGRIRLSLYPTNFSKEKEKWEKDPRKLEIDYIQAKKEDTSLKQDAPLPVEEEFSDDEEEDQSQVKNPKISTQKGSTSTSNKKKRVNFENAESSESSAEEEEESSSESDGGVNFQGQNKFALLNQDD